MREEKMRKEFAFLVVLVFLSAPLNRSIATSSNDFWSDSLSKNLDAWSLSGYNRGPPSFASGTITGHINSGFSIKNGSLTSEFNYVNPTGITGNISFAMHNSTMNYGNWSFDVFFSNWVTAVQHFQISFIFYQDQNDYNFTQKHLDQVFSSSGLFLLFSGNYYSEGSQISLYRNFNFIASYIPNLSNKSLYNTFHHFLINRDLNGKIKVFMDNKLIISTSDGTNLHPIENSQKILITNYYGISLLELV